MVKLVLRVRMVLSLQMFLQINQDMNKPKLAPLNESGVSELLNKVHMLLLNVLRRRLLPYHTLRFIFLQEIARLQEENNKLKGRLRSLESQVWLIATAA